MTEFNGKAYMDALWDKSIDDSLEGRKDASKGKPKQAGRSEWYNSGYDDEKKFKESKQ